MANYSFTTRGVCARKVSFDIDNNKVKNVSFMGGCQGNTTGVARLIDGMDVDDAIARLTGIDCGGKGTSCPDQLAKALMQAKQA